MLLFFTLVFSRYNEVIFLYNNKIIDSLGFVFESDSEEDSLDFKISHINPYIFSTSLDESSITLDKRSKKGNYSIFLIDLSNYNYDWFKNRYFIFQGILTGTILSTPIMKSIEHEILGLEDDLIPLFFQIGLKENFIDDLFSGEDKFLEKESLSPTLLFDDDWCRRREHFSNLINKGVPFLSGKKPDEIFNNKRVLIQNKSGREREEYFQRVLNDEEKSLRDIFFENKLKESQKLNPSKKKKKKKLFKKIWG